MSDPTMPKEETTTKEKRLAASIYPLITALKEITDQLAEHGYDVRDCVAENVTRAKVGGGYKHNSVTGFTARSRDGLVSWTIRYDWDKLKQTHVNGSWSVKTGEQHRSKQTEKFYAPYEPGGKTLEYYGVRMMDNDSDGGQDVGKLWDLLKNRFFVVNPLSERSEPSVVVPRIKDIDEA